MVEGGSSNAWVMDDESLCFDSHGVVRFLLSSARKSGTPTKDVMTPIGISVGDSTNRAAISASVRRAAPAIKESGSRAR